MSNSIIVKNKVINLVILGQYWAKKTPLRFNSWQTSQIVNLIRLGERNGPNSRAKILISMRPDNNSLTILLNYSTILNFTRFESYCLSMTRINNRFILYIPCSINKELYMMWKNAKNDRWEGEDGEKNMQKHTLNGRNIYMCTNFIIFKLP